MTSDEVAGIIRRAGNEVKLVISRDMVGVEPHEERVRNNFQFLFVVFFPLVMIVVCIEWNH